MTGGWLSALSLSSSSSSSPTKSSTPKKTQIYTDACNNANQPRAFSPMMMIISGRHANNSLRTPNPNPPYKDKDKNNQITRPLFPPNFPTFVLFFKFGAQSKKS
jgi:hypothetical protein